MNDRIRLYRLRKAGISVVANIARYLVLLAFAYMFIYPFLFMVVNALKYPADWYDPTVQWVPKQLSLESFKVAINVMDYWRALGNTFFYEIFASLLQFCSCAVAAYGLARFNFKGKGFMIALLFMNILIPVTMIIIPSYVNFRYTDFFGILGVAYKLFGYDLRPNLLDTPLVFWLPSLLGVGLKGGLITYIYTKFFSDLPKELEEASWIDGAGPVKTFLFVVVPSSGAVCITTLIFSVIWHWSEYYLPLMLLSDNYPLSVSLAKLPESVELSKVQASLTSGSLNALNMGSALMAGSLLYLIPMLVFYLIMQKRFVTSIATSGIVG